MSRWLWSVFLMVTLCGGCESREEIMITPLDGGTPRWLVVEEEGRRTANQVREEAIWLVGQAIGRASCIYPAEAKQGTQEPAEAERPSSSLVQVGSSAPRSASSRSLRPVDPNTATLRQLERLPRIGPATARAIADGRPYTTVEDLRRVRGIGPATLEELRPLLLITHSDGH